MKLCPQTGKVRFATASRVFRARDFLQTKGRPECRAYVCHFCSSWHLTSQPYRERPVASESRS